MKTHLKQVQHFSGEENSKFKQNPFTVYIPKGKKHHWGVDWCVRSPFSVLPLQTSSSSFSSSHCPWDQRVPGTPAWNRGLWQSGTKSQHRDTKSAVQRKKNTDTWAIVQTVNLDERQEHTLHSQLTTCLMRIHYKQSRAMTIDTRCSQQQIFHSEAIFSDHRATTGSSITIRASSLL